MASDCLGNKLGDHFNVAFTLFLLPINPECSIFPGLSSPSLTNDGLTILGFLQFML